MSMNVKKHHYHYIIFQSFLGLILYLKLFYLAIYLLSSPQPLLSKIKNNTKINFTPKAMLEFKNKTVKISRPFRQFFYGAKESLTVQPRVDQEVRLRLESRHQGLGGRPAGRSRDVIPRPRRPSRPCFWGNASRLGHFLLPFRGSSSYSGQAGLIRFRCRLFLLIILRCCFGRGPEQILLHCY